MWVTDTVAVGKMTYYAYAAGCSLKMAAVLAEQTRKCRTPALTDAQQ